MKVKRYESLLMVAIGCGLILMACYSLFTMSFQVQSFRTIDYLPPLGRKYSPLFIPLTELVFAYGILWGIKKRAWSIYLFVVFSWLYPVFGGWLYSIPGIQIVTVKDCCVLQRIFKKAI